MRTLSDDDTELRNFFPQLRRTAGQIAPVADTYAELFVNMATTFEALSRHEQSLRDTLERAPDTLEAGIQSFPVQRPFLRDSGELAGEARAGGRGDRALPAGRGGRLRHGRARARQGAALLRAHASASSARSRA